MKAYSSYRPQAIAANGSYKVSGARMGGFMPTASGTMTVTDADGTVHLNALAVTAGSLVVFPIHFNTNMGGTVSLASSAAGTLLV